MVGRCAGPIADNLHPADHLAHGEETKDLRRDNASRGELRTVHVPDACQEVGRLTRDLRGVLEGAEEGLEVGLEGLRRAARENEYGIGLRNSGEGFAYGGLILRA